MTNLPSPTAVPANRPVLFWRPDSDESHVQATVAQAAEFLNMPADAILSAIDNGELLNGWFVDWQVPNSQAAGQG
jgi:hypothetical protein